MEVILGFFGFRCHIFQSLVMTFSRELILCSHLILAFTVNTLDQKLMLRNKAYILQVLVQHYLSRKFRLFLLDPKYKCPLLSSISLKLLHRSSVLSMALSNLSVELQLHCIKSFLHLWRRCSAFIIIFYIRVHKHLFPFSEMLIFLILESHLWLFFGFLYHILISLLGDIFMLVFGIYNRYIRPKIEEKNVR